MKKIIKKIVAKKSCVCIKRLIAVLISIAGALIAIATVLHIIRYMKYHKIYGTWRGAREVDGRMHTYTFTLTADGKYEFKEYVNDSVYRMLHGNYVVNGNWVVLHNSNHEGEIIEYLYKEGRLFNDGTAYTK